MTDKIERLSDADQTSIRQHVERVLSSQAWIQADRLRRFLQYLVDHALSGEKESREKNKLNQYAIAIDVFDRDASFDPAIDAIVRVEAGRLRSKLLEYYDDEGRDEPVRISLPKRGYAAHFTIRTQRPNPAPTEMDTPSVHPTSPLPLDINTPTIAVLPFDNMSTDPEQEYFSDGITEDLITDLSRLPGLSVIARQSTFVYKGVATNTKEVSAKLGAEFIIEGSVRKFGSRIRINAQLIHGKTGSHIWAERFDREHSDIFDLQDDVNRKIVDALRLQLSGVQQSRLQRKGTDVVEAHDYLLRGIREADKYTREGFAKAEYCFTSALELDPAYASAHSRLSLITIYQWIAGWSDSFDETVGRGLEQAEKAVAMDGESAIAHAALCWALLWHDNYDAAIAAGEKAAQLDPNDASALERLAFALAWSGLAEDALQRLAKAQLLNPLRGYHFPSAVCYFMNEQYSAAVDCLRSSINAHPTFLPAYLYLAACLSLMDQPDEARSQVKHIKELDPDYRLSELRHSNFRHEKDRDRFFQALDRVMETP
jgi:adenylate cyclase